MLQGQSYQVQSTQNTIKSYQISNAMAPGSPPNVNGQCGFQIQPRVLNSVFTHGQSTLNPQSSIPKPNSPAVYTSVQSPKNNNQYLHPRTGVFTQPVGAINTRINQVQTNQNVIVQNLGESRQSNQSVFAAKKAPTRPNYHFFGTDSRNNAQRSNSPPINSGQYGVHYSRSISPPAGQQNARQTFSRNVYPAGQVINQNINSQSHSHSPLSVHSDSSSKNKLIHRVNFSYHNPNFASTTHVIQHVSHMSVYHPQQAAQADGQVQIHPHPQPIPQQLQPIPYPTNQITHVQNKTVIQTTTIVWEHRFVEIYSKFQIFVQKFETIIEEIYNIDDLFDNVNDQEAWNDLRVRYTDMIQNFNIMREEIIMVLEQNKAAINSLSPEVVRQISEKQIAEQKQNQEGGNQQNQQEYEQEREEHREEGGETGKSGSQNNNHVWQNRCLELMQQHQLLTKENNELKEEIQRLRIQDHQEQAQGPEKKPREGQNQTTKVLEMQRNLNTIHSEYQKLEENYNKLSSQYTRVVSQFQNQGHSGSNQYQHEIAQMEQQLEMAQSKINELYEQLQIKNSNIEEYEKEIQGYGQILEQNKTLIETVNKMHSDLDAYEAEFKNKEQTIQNYTNEINNLHQQLASSTKVIEQKKLQSNGTVRIEELNKKNRQIETLKQQEKSLLNMIEKHQQSIEEMVLKNQRLTIEFQSVVRQKEGQIRLLEQFLEQQRSAKNRAMSQSYQSQEKPANSLIDERTLKDRIQIQVQEAVNEKNRKIRLLSQDLQDLKLQIEAIHKQKQKQIKQIKQFFMQEEQKYLKKITEKETSLKASLQRLKSFQSELSNRNLQISRFRHQSPVNSFSASNQQSRKHAQALDKKNHEIQQLRRTIQQKNINIKEMEQKVNSFEQELNNKMFEISSLKRQVNDQHSSRAQIDSLNNTIKKKNQEISELRLTGMEIEQLKINIDSLERQKIRLNEYLKEKTRQCESKDSNIQSLERKMNSITTSMQSYGLTKKTSVQGPSQSVLVNYQNLLKQKETEIKNLKYETEMLQTKISISEKTIRDLNVKVTNYQKSSSLLKADIQNKASKYENEVRAFNKELKGLKDVREELKNIIDSLQSKNQSLQKSLDERNNLFDKQISRNKQKVSSIQQLNTTLLVDQQLHKNQVDRLTKDNKELNEKIKGLEVKLESKNNDINELKSTYTRKEKDDMKAYEDRIKKLDGELKLSSVRIRNLEQEIANLNKKIQHAEGEKKSYRERLINQQSQQKTSFIDLQQAAASSRYDIISHQILEMDKFRLKDPEANDIFERKVIYELKRENDLLRKELSSVGPSSYSVNKYDQVHHQMSYQQEFFTERDQKETEIKQSEYNNEIITFFKNKNKEQQTRIDQLLRVNTDLKDKISSISGGSGNQLSVQFYKEQITKLESQVSQLQNKIKKMLNDHKSSMDDSLGHQHQAESLKEKLNQQNLKINQMRKTIGRHQDTIAQLENTKAICYAQIQRLKQTIQKLKSGSQESSKKDRTIAELNRKQKSLQEQVSKLTNKVAVQAAEIDRLNESIRSRKNELDSKFNENSQQSKKLKKRILELERQLQILKLEHQSVSESGPQNAFKLQKLRSFLVEIESLVGQIPISEKRVDQIIKRIRTEVQQGFAIISTISVYG